MTSNKKEPSLVEIEKQILFHAEKHSRRDDEVEYFSP